MQESEDLYLEARRLLSGRLHGVLSTQSLDLPGHPFGSLIPYSLGPDGWPLVLLSHLAKHTRNLQADNRCSLTVIASSVGDIQKQLRISCMGRMVAAEPVDRSLRERHFRYFPDSRPYHEQLNFLFYRLQPEKIYAVGGFGAARWLGVERLRAPTPFSPVEEQQLLQWLLQRDLKLDLSWSSQRDNQRPDPVGLDGLGLDLRLGEQIQRVPFPDPVVSPETAMDALHHCLASGN